MEQAAKVTLIPEGKCYICGESLSKDEMSAHLESCREKHPPRPSGKREYYREKVFHLVVEGADLPQYWMHLEAPAGVTLTDLDDLLRRVWLECCGHLSQFTIEGKEYVLEDLWEDEQGDGKVLELKPEDESMDTLLAEVLRPGMTFTYEYDMGDTTELRLHVVSERLLDIPGRFIRIVARNNRPDLKCSSCGKVAAQICAECYFDGEGWLCESCSSKHKCDEAAVLPLLNSPRTGVCGYGREWDEEDYVDSWEE